MLPLLELSTSSTGQKRTRPSGKDDVKEGLASDWHNAAYRSKQAKLEVRPCCSDASPSHLQHSRISPARTLDQMARFHHTSILSPNNDTSRRSTAGSNAKASRWTADPTKLGVGKKARYYGVLRGRKPGIYYSWDDAKAQVHGFKDAAHKSFTEARAVEAFMNQNISATPPLPTTNTGYASALPPRGSGDVPGPTVVAVHSLPPSSCESHDQSIASSQKSGMSLTTCDCGKREKDFEATVQCANIEGCRIGEYHKTCVGLANRPVPAGWLCVFCRPSHIKLTSPHKSSSVATQQSVVSHEASQSHECVPVTADLGRSKAEELPKLLHWEQEQVVACVVAGYNVFYTGSAGTGKSTVLREFVRRIRNQGKHVDVIAPSGIAALNVGGKTIHSYAGWYPALFKEPIEVVAHKGWGKQVRKRLCNTDVLVIDEISMVERDMFSRLDALVKEARHGYKDPHHPLRSPHHRNLPFGGCQIIVTGDFFQLPPVKPFQFCLWCGGPELDGWKESDSRPSTCLTCKRTFLDSDKWPFTCGLWEECQFQTFELDHIHRQSDEQFIRILRKFRLRQQLTEEEKGLLMQPKPNPLGAVQLLPTKRQVEFENKRNYDRLSTLR